MSLSVRDIGSINWLAATPWVLGELVILDSKGALI